MSQQTFNTVVAIAAVIVGLSFIVQAGALIFIYGAVKKLNAVASSCSVYCGPSGLDRFVNGNYARGLPLAVMAAIVLDNKASCVRAVQTALASACGPLAIATFGSNHWVEPSQIFPRHATFDTQHRRSPGLAPPHGTISVSHLFLEFGYRSTPPAKRNRAKKSAS